MRAASRATGRFSLGDALAVLDRDMPMHLTSDPVSEAEMQRLEASLGHPLPESYRALLALLGGGLYYDRHEIFGPHIVMIHDIEIVPSVLSMRARLAKELGPARLAGFLPLHRSEGRIHLIDVRPSTEAARVVALDGPEAYADLAAFLEAVVLP